MDDHWIYTDFKTQVNSIRSLFEGELQKIPKKLLPLATHYLRERLFILDTSTVKYDPRIGRPVPYLVFWVSDAMKLSNEKVVNQLALSLYYISIVVSVRDDLVDGRVIIGGETVSEHCYVALTNYFYRKYYEIFTWILPRHSIFWYILSQSLNEWFNYEVWSFLFDRRDKFTPLSSSYLRSSSRYLLAITLPTLAAIALMAQKQSQIAMLTSFLKDYSMGWKIVDDLRDWRRDLNMPNYNHSTIIYRAMNFVQNGTRIDPYFIEGMFLNKAFVLPIYKTILRNFANAKKDVRPLKSKYLDEFIDIQRDYYFTERDSLLNAIEAMMSSVSTVVKK